MLEDEVTRNLSVAMMAVVAVTPGIEPVATMDASVVL